MKKAIKWIVILAVVGGGGYWAYQAKMKKKDDTKPTYDRAKVEIRDVRTLVESTGEIQPQNRLDIKPPIGGRLEELLVDEGDPVDAGQIIGWVSSTERATLLDAARATSTDEYEYWKKLYKPTPLISPLKGTVIARNFEPGQSIEAKDAVVAIADDLIVVASLDETDIGQVQLDQKVNVRLEAYPDREFAGKVEKIAYDARTVQNVTMYEVDVRPDNLPAVARSGMTANLEFVVQEKTGVLAVPAAAVVQGSSGSKGGSKGGDKNGGTPDPDRREKMLARMRESGMSDADIKERLAAFQNGGGHPGGGKSGGGKKGAGSYVLVDSGNPESPDRKPVKTGISDGSYTEVLEGLVEGDEVLIQKIKIAASKPSTSSSPFTPSMGRR
ncbi:MAG: efflux RND transporter periplasmic adaptor subunit [Kiritimatiellales bacterium]|nr:efflux RND transporter periplasmic adaptor subunit [Kiritimatiellales bacterium]MCF7863572.1 efflux RND transporter periplasmic adaptor subunit [Kiritimatiellales bacterium]